MFYMERDAVDYFFDGSLFVMIIDVCVPPPQFDVCRANAALQSYLCTFSRDALSFLHDPKK